jgi:malate/lactate dehydrogenase
MSEPITSDNIHLSRPKIGLSNCTDLPEAVAGYVRDSLAENTRRAYQSDLRHFEMWGGSLPASPETVVPVGAFNPNYGTTLSLPSVLGRAGVSRILEPDMSEDELQGLKRSAGRLRDALERIMV